MRSKAPLVLMEQIILLAVFALAAAVCVQAFVLSGRISRAGGERDRALIAAQSVAEAWKSCGGDVKAAAEIYGGTASQGAWVVCYDTDWNKLSGDDVEQAIYTVSLLSGNESQFLCAANIAADRVGADGTDPIVVLHAACQENAS